MLYLTSPPSIWVFLLEIAGLFLLICLLISVKRLHITNTQKIAILTIVAVIFWTLLAPAIAWERLFDYHVNHIPSVFAPTYLRSFEPLMANPNPAFVLLFIIYLIILGSGILLMWAFKDK